MFKYLSLQQIQDTYNAAGIVMQEQKVSWWVPVPEEPAAPAPVAQGGHLSAIPTINLLCRTCEKALPFLSHAAECSGSCGPPPTPWQA